MTNGKTLFQNGETKMALNIFSEVLCLFPTVLEAHEYRALCLFYLVGATFVSFHNHVRLYSLSAMKTATFLLKLFIFFFLKGDLGEARHVCKRGNLR